MINEPVYPLPKKPSTMSLYISSSYLCHIFRDSIVYINKSVTSVTVSQTCVKDVVEWLQGSNESSRFSNDVPGGLRISCEKKAVPENHT